MTFVATDDGITAWRALPDGSVAASTLDRDEVVAAAVALLAPVDDEAAAMNAMMGFGSFGSKKGR